MEASSCCICLNCGPILYKITEKVNDDETITPFYKLLICLPDIDWLQDYQICNLCKDNLHETYDFREMCFKSEFLRCDIKIEDNKDEMLDNGDDLKTETRPPVENTTISNVCNICSNFTESLLSKMIANAQEGRLSSISKLRILIKSINWLDSFNICNLCEERLNKAYDFYELCFKNQFNTLAIESKLIKIEPIDNDNVEIESSEPTILLDNNCTYCGCIFDSKEQLLVHLRSEHPTEIERCDEETNLFGMGSKCKHCNKEFKSHRTLQIHLARMHNIDRKRFLKHECHLCLKRLVSQMELKSHLRTVHLNICDFKCDQCSKAFKSKQMLQKHLSKVHLVRIKLLKHECQHCSRRFLCPTKLKRHLDQVHLNIYDFKCEQCGKDFKWKSLLQKHLAIVHDIGINETLKHECHHCSKRFLCPNKLKLHLDRVHLNICEFKCEQCNKEYKSRLYLQSHLARVHNVRIKETLIHECSICLKRFVSPYELKSHLALGHGIGVNETLKHECNHCSRRFSCPNRLKMHLDRVHLNISGYKCEQCDKTYKSNSYLQNHLARVHEVGLNETLRYECHHCSKRFVSPKGLNRHLRLVHLDTKF